MRTPFPALMLGLFLGWALMPAAFAQSFYDADATELAGEPGTIIRSQPVMGAPKGASAFKVLYRSRGLHDEPIAVSAIIIVPRGRAPAGGRPVVAWAHPTTGIARKCAPSMRSDFFRRIPGLGKMLRLGYVVAATDYPGLGTVGPHPYMIGLSEGRAVLDSVRAARRLKAAATSNQFALWGHSQGGHAVLFAGEMAKSYAPELLLAGIAAAAPPTEITTLLKAELTGIEGKVLAAYALRSWSEIYHLSLDGVVLERASLVTDRVASFCNETYHQDFSILFAEQPLERQGFLAVDITVTEPWARLIQENTPGQRPPGAPLFLVQGTSDEVVLPRTTVNFVKIQCQRGAQVQLLKIRNASHIESAKRGAAPAIRWIAQRFAHRYARSDCGRG
jgi:alpha-beta hydrolase superfamily lysophospholipase